MTSRFAHDMPFGARLSPRGASVRFRLWAPAQETVSVVLADRGLALPMVRLDQGWFELETDQAAAGTPYRFRLTDGFEVPDPASRCQLDDVHGASVVVDPAAYLWRETDWLGRTWSETVLYELHTGCFTPEGSFDGVRRKLDHLAAIGMTAVELMPIGDFPGARNWGYDAVLPFAPDRTYGRPEDLKRLIDEAHARELMVFLDVIYNHFGPDGNYLHLTAPAFFTDRFHTPWGAAIDFSHRPVRDFYIHNALYWLEEYRIDGLRLDAVHAIRDESDPDILVELARRVHDHFADTGRDVHLVLENDANQARYLARHDGVATETDPSSSPPLYYTAQWNDDVHHAFHVLLTDEEDGYYEDYSYKPAGLLARGLAEGFIYQGQASDFRDGATRGEASAHLPPTAFINFLQTHDQVGNRAFGERLTALAPSQAVEAALTVLLQAPAIPMLFMGEEWGAREPFLFFCDFGDDLADAVRDGRRQEFARFEDFSDAEARARIPDPLAVETYDRSELDWFAAVQPHAQDRIGLVKSLLQTRHARIIPLLDRIRPGTASRHRRLARGTLQVTWPLSDGGELAMMANLSEKSRSVPAFPPEAERLFAYPEEPLPADGRGRLELVPWSVVWALHDAT